MYKTTLWKLLFGGAICLVGAQEARSQSTSLIQQEIDGVVRGSRWQLGPLRLAPSISIGGGYDSNAFSSSEFQQDDLRFVVAPGLRVALPFGNRGYVGVTERVGLVYYHDAEQLRDINNNTAFGGAFGGNTFVVRIDERYQKGRRRPSSEFDIPVDQRSNYFAAELDAALGWRHKLSFSYANYLLRIEDAGVAGEVEDRLNRNEVDYGLKISRHMTEKTSAILQGFYQTLDFDEKAVQRDGWAYGFRTGFEFTPRTNLSGSAVVGYKQMTPQVQTQEPFSGLIASVNTAVILDDRFRLRALYARDVAPSIIENNWYFVQNRYGGALGIYVTDSISVDFQATFGRNTYPRPITVGEENEQENELVVVDQFDNYSLTLGFRVSRYLTLSLVGSYQGRDSNFKPFQKDRFLFNVGIGTQIL